ncbi:hypothetical protein SAMN06297387_110132 [Streptomyces zhaozhouensis]|uniref:Uncharacterized protein n=1 Tax=Streptomyces zhaozhouensis TaxID=1300267 RepID=A0A286DXP2_9ACTN|nr:hypothetical protein SAMN06297387_110132 [Streptomyces zhaozhouensis]
MSYRSHKTLVWLCAEAEPQGWALRPMCGSVGMRAILVCGATGCKGFGPGLLPLVNVNTLLPQRILAEPTWAKKLTDEDRRGLAALFWSNINP